MVISVLLPEIKADLDLSDTQLGLLTGIAFALFYSVFGFPIARLADRHNRVRIISIALAAWSFMTVLCGLAQNYIQLLLARMGVGVGESGAGPSITSLVGDYLPAEKRSIGFALIGSGQTLGAMAGIMIGGLLSSYFGWRMTFILFGIPGILAAIVLVSTVTEPMRGRFERQVNSAQSNLKQTASFLWQQKAYVQISIAIAVVTFPAYGVVTWMPSYFAREFNLDQAQIGLFFGLVYGVGSILGTIIGGFLSAAAIKRDPRLGLLVSGFGLLAAFPLFAAVLYSSNLNIALSFYFFQVLLAGFVTPPIMSLVVGIVQPDMRAMAAAIIGFLASLIGMGLGPFAVGILSDVFGGGGTAEALRLSLLTVSALFLWPLIHLWLASNHLERDLSRVSNASVNTLSNS